MNFGATSVGRIVGTAFLLAGLTAAIPPLTASAAPAPGPAAAASAQRPERDRPEADRPEADRPQARRPGRASLAVTASRAPGTRAQRQGAQGERQDPATANGDRRPRGLPASDRRHLLRPDRRRHAVFLPAPVRHRHRHLHPDPAGRRQRAGVPGGRPDRPNHADHGDGPGQHNAELPATAGSRMRDQPGREPTRSPLPATASATRWSSRRCSPSPPARPSTCLSRLLR